MFRPYNLIKAVVRAPSIIFLGGVMLLRSSPAKKRQLIGADWQTERHKNRQKYERFVGQHSSHLWVDSASFFNTSMNSNLCRLESLMLKRKQGKIRAGQNHGFSALVR